MSSPAHSPITTETKLSLPLNGTIYTTTRQVASEKPLPSIGSTMAGELGAAWADSYVIGDNKVPATPQAQQSITHARIPSEEAQLASNWEFSTCDMGGTRFPSVSRTFVLLASAVAHDTPAKGSAMPFVPGDLFDGKGYILVDRQVVRSGMELEPVFRVERRSYVIKSAMRNLGVDPLNGKMLTSTTTLYYATETVIAGVSEPQTITVTGTLTPDATDTMNRVEDLGGSPQFSTAVDGTTYPATRSYHNGTAWVLSHHTGASLVPYAFWTSDPCTLEECPSPADASGWAPTLGVGMATPTGTPIFTDDTAYTPDTTAADLFADPTNAFWGIQTDGTQRTGQQLSCGWYSVTQETVVAGVVTDGVVSVDSFTTNDNFYWPPVLDAIALKTWTRRNGGVDIYPTVKMKPEGYNGPCATTVSRAWSKTPFTIPVVTQMLPTSIRYGSPFFNLSVPECLHGSINVTCDIGSNDPDYTANAGSTENFPATNFTAWPSTITAYDDQTPFRGGYLRTTRVVAKPA